MSNSPTHTIARLPAWLVYALIAAICWGVWGVLAKGPSRELSGWMTQILFTIALIPSAFVALGSPRLREGSNRTLGLLWGFIAGILAAGGNIAFYLALEHGADTAIAVPLTNIYPLVTISIAYVMFQERLNRIQFIGIGIAVIAITLLSGEARHLGDPAELWRRLSLNAWLLYAVAAMVLWGVFSAAQKISTNHVSAEASYLAWCAAFIPIAGWIMLTRPLNWDMSAGMLWSGLAAGMLNGFGVIAAFAAYREQGKAAIVTPLAAAVQPLVTIVLALLFLGEHIGVLEALGAALAIISAVALSRESPPEIHAQPYATEPTT
jgi:drug/metabolite transporter (DMT)-like permease